ncbi:hypothetical protein JCM16303_005977 [Sporobolomyces ruberrimus]
MDDPSHPLSGNSVNHTPSTRSLAPLPSFPPPIPPLESHSSNQRYLPPGASYARPSPSSSPSNLHRLETTNLSSQPPVLSLSIGSRGPGLPSPLVGSSEWPSGATPSPSPSTNRNNSPYPPPSPISADPSFAGIPSGRLQQQQQTLYPSSSPSPRQTQSAHFPSFVLPPNLSPNDAVLRAERGPYPPHVRSQSTGTLLTSSPAQYSPGLVLGGGGGEESAEFLVNDPSRTTTMNPNPSSSRSLQIPTSPYSATSPPPDRPLSIADQVVGTPPPQTSHIGGPPLDSPSNNNDPRKTSNPSPYYLEDNTTPITPSDMAGIGRNSIIRSVGATSPVANFRASTTGGGASPQLVDQRMSFVGGPPQPSRNSTMIQAGNPGVNLPPHLVPQPEICVECMMRDRDMADVDVTTQGIWERESDRDWNEQLKWERELEERGPLNANEREEEEVRGELGGGVRGGAGGSGNGEFGMGGGSAASQESGSVQGDRRRGSTLNSRESTGPRPVEKRRKLGRGQLLTSGNLKAWTTMNPPAAAHRWRTLQTFLATQIHLLELDRQARARESAILSSHHSHAPSQDRSSRSSTFQLPISTTPEPFEGGCARAKSGGSRGYLVDETNRKSNASSLLPPPTGHQGPPHPQSHAQPYSQPSPTASSPYPTHPQYIHPSLASSGPSIQSYSYGDQPWLSSQSSRRYSFSKDTPSPPTSTKSPAPSMKFSLPKFARSTTDLRSISSPRSLSPARNSLNVDDRDYGGRRSSTSLWSKFRQSTGNQSVLSFNPSASMMDMHLGLSQDKHGQFGGGGGGTYRNSGYASSTIGLGQRGYSYHQPQSTATAYDTYPGGGAMHGLNMSDPAVARHAEKRERDRALAAATKARGASETASTKDKKKKKGIKGFFSKLVGGGGSDKTGAPTRQQPLSRSAPVTPAEEAPFRGGGGMNLDDDELAPPPPLSALANEPRYHQRSSSTSSVDSFTGPYTPPLHGSNFRSSYAMPLPSTSNPNVSNAADRQSILTMGSYSSARSKPPQQQGTASNGRLDPSRDGGNRPSFDSFNDSLAVPRMANSPEALQHQRNDRGGSAEVLAGEGPDQGAQHLNHPVAQPRLQKSLPSIPYELSQSQPRSSMAQEQPSHPGQFYPDYQPGASRSAYSLVQFPSRPLSPPDSADERDRYSTVGSRNGNARKTRSTVFSFFGKKKAGGEDAIEQLDFNDRDPHRARSFDLVSRY